MAFQKINIVKGPSKFDLMMSFFDIFEGKRRPVIIGIEAPDRVPSLAHLTLVINSLQWEDGSGENWNYEGFVKSSERPDGLRYARGYYSTQRRFGYIELSEHPFTK